MSRKRVVDDAVRRPNKRRQRARPTPDDWELSLDVVFSAPPSREEVDRAMADAATLLGVTIRAVQQRVNERARRREWQSPVVHTDDDIERIQEAPDFDAAYQALADGRDVVAYLAFERALRRVGRRLARLQWRENRKRASTRRSA